MNKTTNESSKEHLCVERNVQNKKKRGSKPAIYPKSVRPDGGDEEEADKSIEHARGSRPNVQHEDEQRRP